MTRIEKITGVGMIVAVACGIALLAVFAPVSLSPSGVSIDNADAFTCPTGMEYMGTSGSNYICQTDLSGDNTVTQNYLYDAGGHVVNVGTTNSVGGQIATPGNPATDQCSSGITLSPATWFSSTCWESTIANTIGTLLIWISSWFLTLAGQVFNYAFDNTILQFGKLINDNIISAINATWSVFRDISNILIIGMFTFIAIMTILGSVDYGAKRLLSRVLIVAVLINFSLLFAKIIIDVSNFTATQFYQNATVATQTTSSTVNSSGQTTFNSLEDGTYGGTNPNADIAGAFIGYAGASSWGNTSAMLTKVQSGTGGAMMVLVYGVVISLMEIAAAIVLLYGTFLLAARALTLIFLMITSSIAFASYLIPSNIGEGFGTWWRLLLKNAVFAPLLVILLWVTLTVAQAFAKTPQSGTLTTALINPTNAASYAPIFEYVIIIALLFISLKVSSSVASSVGGMNLGQTFLSTPFAALSKGGAFLGRKYWGRSAAKRATGVEDQILRERQAQAQAHLNGKDFDTTRLYNLQKQKAQLEKRSKSTFDAMNTTVGKKLAELTKVPKPLATGTKANYADSAKAKADDAAKKAADAILSKNEASAAAEKEINNEDRKEKRNLIEEERKNAQGFVDAQKKSAEDLKKELEPDRATAQKTAEDTEKDATSKITDIQKMNKEAIQQLEQEIAKEENADRSTVMKNQLETRKAQMQRDLDEQTDRIKRAKENVVAIQNKIDGADTQIANAEKSKKAADAKLDDFDKETKRLVDTRTTELMKASKDVAEKLADQHIQTPIQKLLGTKPDEFISQKARKQIKHNQSTKGVKERFNAIIKEVDEGEGGAH